MNQMMNKPKENVSRVLFLIVITFFISACNQHKKTQQSWVLNKDSSSISITTTKNSSISEVSEFTSFTGSISSSGNFEISISLDSLETNIPIRNERIREHLFETSLFPTADIHTQLKPEQLENGVHTITFDADLHGLSSIMTAEFMVTEQNGNKVITLHKPLIINANTFALEKGITKLKNLAFLQSIANTVPVHLILTFQKQ
jgi:polyisoprenoid-binding protein YceI